MFRYVLDTHLLRRHVQQTRSSASGHRRYPDRNPV